MIAVTGSGGLIGKELIRRGCTRLSSKVMSPDQMKEEFRELHPEVIIHCAAITDVRYCEEHFQESFNVNVRGTANVINTAPAKSLIVYLSTDHVFSGKHFFDQGYGEWHKPSPINRYGFSKWGGELMMTTTANPYIIVRSSKVYDYKWAEPTLKQLKDGEEVVMTDLIKRSFVHVRHFVDGLLKMIDLYQIGIEIPKLLNISGDCVWSYYRYWWVLNNLVKLPGKVIPRKEEVKDEAPRPFRAGLNIKQAKRLGIPIYSIEDGVKLLEQGI